MAVTDAYNFTDELREQLVKEKLTVAKSKEFVEISDNAERIKFLEKLLLERNLIPNDENSMKKEKCDHQAKICRDEGNNYYSDRQFLQALECYNKSLCFSPENSENFGIASANRSAVFYELKLYTRSLRNIEEALKHNYPQKSMDKLKKREEICKNMIRENAIQPTNEPIGAEFLKLSHEENPQLPFVAKCLELRSDENFGRYIVTNKNLSAGEIILIEEPFSQCLLPDNTYRYCANCLRDNYLDLIPCSNCTSVMFCSEECRTVGMKKFHQYECSIVDKLNEICTKIMRISSQTFFEALDIYESNIEKLMSACEEESILSNIFDYDFGSDNEHDDDNDKRKNLFFSIDSLVTNESQRLPNDSFQRCGVVAILTHIFLNYTKLNQVLNTEDAKDFYRKFILKQTQIASLNYHGIFDGILSKSQLAETVQYASGSYPFCSLINHSCAPNLVRVSYLSKNYLMVNRPIAAGEQLFDNYGYHHCLEDTTERKIMLKSQYMFECGCESCKLNYGLFAELSDATKDFDEFLGDDIAKLSNFDLANAKSRFQDYCEKINELDKHYPCREISTLQECILRCFFIFKMTPFKLELARK